MAEVINMPRLSDTMEEGKIEVWHKKVGDKIAYGDILAEIETDKAVQEFEADIDGILLWILNEGESTPVESPMAIIGEEGEDISGLLPGGSEENKSSEKSANQKEGETPEVSEIPEDKDDMDDVEEGAADADSSSKSDGTTEIPENVQIINMPRLSDTMVDGKVEVWHKNIGDKVAYGDILAEIETDKAIQEFEADIEGVLLYRIEEAEAVPVDSLMAIIGPEGTDVSAIVASGGKLESKQAPTTENKEVKQEKETQKKEEKTVEVSKDQRIFISPLAKKLAGEKGIDFTQIKGSGENGRIVKKDVENYKTAEKTQEKPVAAKTTPTTLVSGESEKVANSKMRQTIAKRLSQSKFTAPHYYLNIEVDMENIMAARKQINEIAEVKISFNDIIVKAVAMALRKHPQVNSSWTDTETIWHGDINIGVAVAVPDGLVVPVVRHADQKSLSDISTEVKDMAGRSRDKKIKADELEGSTFTVSNLGAYGIESFTSIINQPNSCILSVGAIVEKPVVKNGQILIGNRMKLSMACDHRTVDGATGSLYLQTLKQYLETPMSMFL
ncbi:MAG: 2-oxo acid dehydrogenase subunit E2 [Flavobacteriaceae bacterium]|nr:2-oxo acid dehydrogenase subunit E2 [Flavobacteriaceae bacterium]